MKNMTWLKDTLITHRGLHGVEELIENTRASFLAAMNSGFGIELDTNILKDGTIVVFHDKNLKRLCGVDLALKDLTFEQLQSYTIKGTNECIPTLEEILSLVGGKVPLLIEIKPFGHKKRHAKAVSKLLKNYPYKVAVQSYDPSIVRWFKKHDSNQIRGQISEFFRDSTMHKMTKWALKKMIFNALTKPDFINYRLEDLPNPYVEKAKSKGLVILSYAARNQKALDYARKAFDNAVFENFIPKK